MAHPRSAFGAPPQGGRARTRTVPADCTCLARSRTVLGPARPARHASGPAKPDPRQPLVALTQMARTALLCTALSACPLVAFAQAASAPSPAEAAKLFSFFVTSEGAGRGAELGGLAGADAHCQKLAGAVGAGHKTWRAYLRMQAADGQ